MTTKLEMVCTCQPAGFQEAEDRRLRIAALMNLRAMRDLTTAVNLSLAFDFGAEAHIDADQWFGVSVTSPLGDIWVECDHPGDGLAAAWEHLAGLHPDRVSKDAGTEAHQRRAKRVSEMMVKWYLEAEDVDKGHEEANKDSEHYFTCDDCRVALELKCSAKIGLENTWGSRDLEPAMDAIFA